MDDLISRQAAIDLEPPERYERQYQTMNLDDAYESGWYDALECVEKRHPPTFGLWSLVRNATGTLIIVITSATSSVSHAQTMQTFTVLMVSAQLRCRHEVNE